MDPRMKEKSTLAQTETNFQIRYPWIPQTPVNRILSRSNAISVDRNGNQFGRSNSSELIGQLERRLNQTSKSNRANYNFVSSGSLNQSSFLYSLTNPMLRNRSLTGSNNSIVTGTLLQSSGSFDISNQRIRDRSLQIGNNFNLNIPMKQINNNSSSIYDMAHYQNSLTQTYRNDVPSWSNSHAANRGLMGNAVQDPSFLATNMPLGLVQKTDPMVSMPLLNVNMQTHISPWAMSSPKTMNLHMNPANTPLILNSYAELDSSWTEGNFTNLLLGNGIPDICQNKSLNLNNSPQMLNNVFHVPEQQNYNLNSPVRHGDNAGTSTATPFSFAPITPDYTKLLEKHQQSQMLKFLVDDGSCQEHDKMENFFSSVGKEAIENHCSELLQTIVDSAPAVVSRPEPDKNICKERGEQDVIYLNETPKQKAPRRRKHTPKVVTEGKPKRTPKPKTPKNGNSEENPSRKRKYVQKNSNLKAEIEIPLQTDVANTVKVANSDSRKESCRKRLNFDVEKAEQGEQFTTVEVHVAHHQGNKPGPELNLNFTACHMPLKSLEGDESCASAAPSGTINHGTLDVVARDLSMRKNKIQKKRNIHGELKRNISRANLKLEKTREVRWKSTHQMVERDVGNFEGFCGSEEDSHPIEQVPTSSHHKIDSPSMCKEPIGSQNQEPISPNGGNSSEDTCKKQKVENDRSKLCGSEKVHCTNGNSHGSKIDAENYMQSKLTANQQMLLKRMRERMSSKLNQVHGIGYLDTMTNSNLQSAVAPKEAHMSACQQENENYQDNNHKTRPNVTANPCREVRLHKSKVSLQEPKDSLHQNGQLSTTARGQPKALKYSKKEVDKITLQLRSLSIRCESGETDGKGNYALVPYEGGGALVPYEPKKRMPRPKVDLDPETTRIWKLLMGKEGAEASEAESRDKEKCWQEERRVFEGRADSFIARMHLVQGDRRFSPWKGSVVDSIVGVFLTQNVSDHLSSSAFMALAATFPPSLATPDQGSYQSGASILTEEPEIQGLTPYGTRECLRTERLRVAAEPNQIMQQNASSSLNSLDSSVHHINGEIQSSSRSSLKADNTSKTGKSTNESLFLNRSMHDYKKSAVLDYSKQIQGLDRVNSLSNFSPLNHPNNSSISSIQNSATPMSFLELLMAPQVATSQPNCFEISIEECRSSFPPRTPEITNRGSIGCQYKKIGHATQMMRSTYSQQNGLQNTQTPNIDPFTFINNQQNVQKSSINQVPQTGPPFLNTYQMERSQVYTGFENLREPSQPISARKQSSGNQDPDVLKHSGYTLDIQKETTEANDQVFLSDRSSNGHSIEKISFSEASNGISAKTSNTSQKHQKVKSDSFDWDSLRKMVQPNGRGKERSLDASDSMDYEAMRCADVDVISNSIKIRGMNKMLSERIKDFLNRVVKDHGSIDLEWLRDIPPEKTKRELGPSVPKFPSDFQYHTKHQWGKNICNIKDYLLSIKGLGLKSVECVRLLTLRHLAFPVDTNVGRIAVRLGWVPLQPLPESLQLHLLEMYPVLESVQKYLWPRLCKLDQKTLYELHYQLITFGKVFCTKSKPNCDACPMRGECRHFASAFASARLALPAPEEKGIVGSTMPIAADGRPNLATNPMLLQPSGSNGERGVMMSRCEPIIEEPATPEPENTEMAETDIEDIFYEDPDEIPTIKLNVEQLEVNIRNFMEKNMNMQEGDMSQALVALTPEVASIPAPKLKHVRRLRTERQVYVLTDTHPLVEGLDKREPDDPSPYLFAMLAPGEEARAGEPPGECCESNRSKEVCNEKERYSVNGEGNSETVRGTLLIPCRTAMRGSFPLNGTYFQVNEVFADHKSSINPINVPRGWLWELETRTVFFGTSATSIFRDMTTREIQNSFWRGFVCVRGFDRKTRAPRPLHRNLHDSQSKKVKTGNAA